MNESREILYFDSHETANTDKLIQVALDRARERKIKHAVIAWSSGYTVRKFMEMAEEAKITIKLAVVTNARNAHMPIVVQKTDNEETRKRKEAQLKQGIKGVFISISDETREELEKKGAKVYYVPDYLNFGEPLALTDTSASVRDKLAPFVIAQDLRPLDIDSGADLSLLTVISQGFRVCMGCTALAAGGGLVPLGETVLSIAGRATGLVLKANPDVEKCYIKEILGFERGSAWEERGGP